MSQLIKQLLKSSESASESIPVKFLEQILLTLKNNGILKSKRGANGGYLLAKSSNQISIGMILEIIDGPFDPIGLKSSNDLGAGLEKCFIDMVNIVNNHLNEFTIKEVAELIIKKTDFKIKLIQPQNNSFTSTIRNKLMWGLDKRT